MILFENDYAEGAAPEIIVRLATTNLEQTPGYGLDPYSKSAAEKIRQATHAGQADVHFLVGGTQTNRTVISAMLRPFQGVVAAETAHIATHETGAIEASGHKVLTLPTRDGKITASAIDKLVHAHQLDVAREHTVQPKMVYISQPTETGLLYTKQELMDIQAVCQKFDLLFYLDGARLGYGLAAPENDVSLPDIAALTDAFYFGGTKVGALFGEALIITNPACQNDFRYAIKQNGAMLAKGRLLGLQFDTLFDQTLYLTICGHAVREALRIKQAFAEQGIRFHYDSPTNQQFPILTSQEISQLQASFGFTYWEKLSDDRHAVRFCTSWATKRENVDRLIEATRHLRP
ncbi:threonine aldolase family protein [Listeria costaricensis]|uniref:threonine aldolase family protein n=1 Tax=Listeria costaricensis TaxID=2026604 RepID=UPI000C08895F|nr:aminotransferase class I/II-fold pyridoxal phosphate-dependent enzyme [Listeria costaricensis]